MKLYFENAENLQKGIGYVLKDLDIEISDSGLCVTVEETKETKVSVKLSKTHATITYGGGKARFFRGLATLCGWLRNGETEKEKTETPIFTTNGTMVDMSRNAVMKTEHVKTMMRKIALMGMNMFMLYTEDTYEIENRPMFGYQRGRYTKEELKDMDAYALELGIELVPCIQTLGHLATHLKWPEAAPYRDTGSVLLVGAEETYAFIEDMFKTVTECFTTKRVHVGMDETKDLGNGRYMQLNGYRERSEIYLEHIGRVCELTEKYGLKPMMWSDMFFRMAGKSLDNYRDYDLRVEFPENFREKIPPMMQQVFWEYYQPKQEFYDINIEKHLKYLDENTMFAGGVFLWGGQLPWYGESLTNTIPALQSCKEKGIKEVLATVWHNGSESLHMMCLPGLAWYADFDYTGEYNEESMKTCFYNSCGVSYDELLLCEILDHPCADAGCIGKSLLYSDPMIGLADRLIEETDAKTYYREALAKLEKVKENKDIFAPAFEMAIAFGQALEYKADFGVRLKKAYDEKDKEMLKKLAEECDVIRERVKHLNDVHRKGWMHYNKPFGWEVMDIRYGGIYARFETVKTLILDYLAGNTDALEELKEDRYLIRALNWRPYSAITTINSLM